MTMKTQDKWTFFRETLLPPKHSKRAVRNAEIAGYAAITTRGNCRYFERIAQRKFTISPDTLSRKSSPLKIEFRNTKVRIETLKRFFEYKLNKHHWE